MSRKSVRVETVDEYHQRWLKSPVFSCCSVGSKRWFWVVYGTHEAAINRESPLFTGYASDRESAATATESAFGTFSYWERNWFAQQHHRTLATAKRSQRRSSRIDHALLEFVWSRIYCDGAQKWLWIKQRVMKKTAKRYYVDRQPYSEGRFTEAWDVPTFVLDREKLERDGSDRGFYLKPQQEMMRRGRVPSCLEALGLEKPVTRAKVKQAYRVLSLQKHPDQGGDHEQFILLQQAYEQALALCQR